MRKDLALEKVLHRLDAFDVLILDDIGCIQQDWDEMEVLFTLLAERYERRSVVVTSNLVFFQWDRIGDVRDEPFRRLSRSVVFIKLLPQVFPLAEPGH